jgi:hypothetical protein
MESSAVWIAVCLFFAATVLVVWGIWLINFRPLWNLLGNTFNLFTFLPWFVNRSLSIAVFIELIGVLATIVLWFRKRDVEWRKRLVFLQISTGLSVGLLVIVLIGWGVITLLGLWLMLMLNVVVFSGKLPQIIVVLVMLGALGALMSMLTPLTKDAMTYLGEFHRRPQRSAEQWRLQFEVLEADRQARLILRTTARSLGLHDDSALLNEFKAIEKDIKKEPALSAYWVRRKNLEAIDRQKQV